MPNPTASFFLGLLCTVGMFAFCVIAVVCVKILYLWVKDKLYPQKIEPKPLPQKPPEKQARKKPATAPKPVRSIEIDPEQVDKIYVKKIS